jgi:glycerophosphoryl diester phosphodiesterase
VENTLPSYTAALREGANAIEVDLCVTADHEVVVWHDASPDDVASLARQIGLEGLPFVPDVPSLGSPFRTTVRNLTLAELREHYGYAPNPDVLDDEALEDAAAAAAAARVPTLEELAEWTRTGEASGLGALFLDVKLSATDLDLLPVLAEKILALFGDAPYAIFIMSPSEPVVVAMRDWLDQHAPELRGGLMFDFETDGALDAALRLGLSSVSTGKTALRSWDGYLAEMQRITDGVEARAGTPVDTVVSWTIDDENRMQSLLDLGVDGILTNRPGDLARMADRGFSDHDRVIRVIADCHAAHEGSAEGARCATGSELGLFGPLREEQLVSRACDASTDALVRDVFGCGGPLDAQNVTFDTDVLPGDEGGIYWNGYSGEVLVTSW